MKKFFAIGLMLAGSTAFGTTARYNALQRASHIQDVSTVFTQGISVPTGMMVLPELMSLNFGMTTPTPAVGDAAEGGMIRNTGDSRIGFFVGVEDAARSTGYLGIENPFSVAYGAKAGDMPWAIVFSYANSSKKATAATFDDQTQSFMRLDGSVVVGDLTVGANLGLTNKAKGDGTSDTAENSQAPMTVFGYYAMGDLTAYGTYMMNTTKDNPAGTETKTEDSKLVVGAVNTMKKEGADFFYEVAYSIKTSKTGAVKSTETRLPVLIGVEADAASWLTLRGSVKQNVLLGDNKVDETESTRHDTTVAAGAGLKFNKATLDFTLSAANTGNLNSALGAQAGLTYLF